MTFYKKSRRELSDVRKMRAAGAPRKRLVAKRRRYEGVYNRIAAASAIACGEEERRSGRAMTFYKKSRRELSDVRDDVELMIRFELTTSSLPMTCSTY